MNISITWNSGDTWRKLGYYYYTNSLSYRAVIEQNPQWSVLESPPEGVVLSLNVNNSRSISGLSTSGFFPNVSDVFEDEIIFPFDSRAEYDAQASKYSVYSLLNYNECNGYTQDTSLAAYGQP